MERLDALTNTNALHVVLYAIRLQETTEEKQKTRYHFRTVLISIARFVEKRWIEIMTCVKCKVETCKNNKDGYCDSDYITISDMTLTAAGFIPQCEDCEEDDDEPD